MGVVGGQLAVGRQHIVVGQNIAGQVFDGGFIGAAAVQHKQVGVGPGGLQYGAQVGTVRHVPAGDGVPRNRVPGALGAAAVASGVLPFQHHGKVGAGIRGILAALQILHRVGQCDRYHGAGVGAGVPRVGRKQGGQFRVVGGKIEMYLPGGAVSGGNIHFLEHELAGLAGTAVLVFQVVQAQQRAVGVLEHKVTVGSRGAGGDQILRVVCIVFVGVIQVKPGARHRVADLVHLDEVALGDGNQVEFQLHVGVHIAPLQVEEFQGVVGVVGKRGAAAVGPVGPRRQEFVPQGAHGPVIDGDGARDKVDGQGCRIVDAAQIPHQNIVDENPYVIVAGKVIGHGGAARRAVHGAVGLLDKPGGHGQAEIVIHKGIA